MVSWRGTARHPAWWNGLIWINATCNEIIHFNASVGCIYSLDQNSFPEVALSQGIKVMFYYLSGEFEYLQAQWNANKSFGRCCIIRDWVSGVEIATTCLELRMHELILHLRPTSNTLRTLLLLRLRFIKLGINVTTWYHHMFNHRLFNCVAFASCTQHVYFFRLLTRRPAAIGMQPILQSGRRPIYLSTFPVAIATY